MAFFLFGRKGEARRVPDGQFEKRRCPKCDKTTVFRECVVEKTYTAYLFVNLWSSTSTQFGCDACGSIMDLADTRSPELSAREKKQQLAIEAKQAKITAKEAKVAQRRKLKEAAAREQGIDDEIAAMKARLGIDNDR